MIRRILNKIPTDDIQVCQALEEFHGPEKAPDVVPPPSLMVTGCGEVPDLLDALLRTYISSATTAKNSNKALKGMGIDIVLDDLLS